MNYAGKFDAKLLADGSGALSDPHFHVETISPHATHAPADAIIVPDAQLLFNGDFKRSGVDLILSKDDHELVLQDYFKGEKRAALSSPDGAHLTGDIVNALTGHVEYSQAADGSASAGQVIGHVTKLVGSATAIRNGVSIILNQGDNVEKGDVVQSGSDSTLGVTFIDGTVFGLSSNARMVLNDMVYDPNGSNNSSLLSLVAGTISFVAGETAKHGDMKIDTPVATMGIRGTAVLVEIDFNVPGQGGGPEAKFQVLVEPDGHTGSYILFDKGTLTPIATVNQAGQQVNISQGNVSITNSPLSPDVQKLITDVFSLKFTDNTNPKSLDHFTDTITPQTTPPIILASGASAVPVIAMVNHLDNVSPSSSVGPTSTQQHIDGPPIMAVFGNALAERAGVTGSTAIDTVSNKVNFVDINKGDAPTVSTSFDSFTYQDAHQHNIKATLNAKQLADIAAVEVKLVVVADPSNNNNGSATWTYSVADGAFDFLAAGETLTLTYVARVDNNYAPNDEAAFKSFTITITGTNDVPVITTGPQTIAFSGGITTPGGNLTTNVPTTGTLSFTDADLTDTHTVATTLTSAKLSGANVIPPGPLKIFETALTASIAADSTGAGNGTISWKLADLPVYLADFIPQGQILTLTYTVTLTDSQNTTSAQTVTVTITGTASAAVVWIATSKPGSSPGGLWSDASNWETGTVPTASDDAIIITNQLIGLTPSYPVTINAPAVAKSVTMNDFGTSPPQLINQSTLTIGGAFNLSADSIVDNSGAISVGGLMEMLNKSVLQNSGLVTLGHGGDFKDQSTVKNTSSGTIEVSGGTLNVLVDVSNSGHVTVDPNATLTLKGAAIAGGTVTNKTGGTIDLTGAGVLENGKLNNSGQIKVSGTGNALDAENVNNSGSIEVLGLGTLTLDQLTTVANGGGTITVDGSGTLALDQATITGGTVNDYGLGTDGITILAGFIDVIGSSTINGDASLNYGGVTVESGRTLTLDNVTVTGTTITGADVTSTVHVDNGHTLTLHDATISRVTLTMDGTLDSYGSTAITNVTIDNTGTIEATGGVLTIDPVLVASIDNSGWIEANGGELDLIHQRVINSGTLEAVNGSLLVLNNTTVNNTGGTIEAVDPVQSTPSTVNLQSATIIGGVLATISDGIINATSGVNAIDGATINNAGILESTGGTLTIDAASIVNNTGMFVVNGGNLIVDTAFSGSAEIIGASLLELGAAASNAYLSANILFAAAATGTLKLDHSESFGGTVSNLDDNRLDLGDITSGLNTTVTYSGDATHGILTIVNNADPTQVAYIHLTGDYLGSSFVAASDGHGGTSITEVPGAIAGLDSYGNAVEGNQVTASITDGGQSVTNVTYQWMLDGHDILNATGATYVPTEADTGHALTVDISFKDALNHSDTSMVSAGTVVDTIITGTAESASLAALNLVVNGGFETGNFNGWTQSGNTLFTVVSTQGAHSGSYYALLGPFGSDGHLTQNIPTVAGEHYTLDFWLSADGGAPNDFSVTWNGTALFPELVNSGAQHYTEYKFDVVGSGLGSALQFNFRDDPTFWHLDDVSVTSQDVANGTISFSDPHDTLTASVTPAGQGYLGTFSLGPVNQVNGSGSVDWHFSATGSDGQQFFNPPSGQPISQTYNVAISDGHSAGTVVEKVGLMVGSSASDTFTFAPGMGQETVFNFSLSGNADLIELDHFGISNFAQLNLQSVDNSHDTLINLGHNDTLLLVGVQANNLHANDFLLHA